MADPVSVGGTVVGIISLGIQTTHSMFDYYSAFRSQYPDIKDTIRKLDNLLGLFKTLRSHIDGRQFRADEQDLIRQIESFVDACEEYVQELRFEAEKFQQYPVNDVVSAIKTTTRRVAYPFRKSTLVKLDENVDGIVEYLKLALQLLQQDIVDQTRDDIEEVKALLELVRDSQLSRELQEWLQAPDASINFNEAHRKRHPATGSWLISGKSFTFWLKSRGSFLWLKGFAGCGKSVLCSTAIQYTFRFRRSNPKIGIAFFFFTFNDENKQDASALLRSLVSQLASQLASDSNPIRWRKTLHQATPPDYVLLDYLHELIKEFQDVYILIDALDESPRDKHRERVLQTLADIRAWIEPRLHLLVTSREEVDIREILAPSPESVIEMRNDKVDKDIAVFVARHLREERKFDRWKKHHETIQEVLTKRANGVFRWVECQFKSLARCPPNQQLLERLLQSLPESLDETYARVLRKIPPELISYAQQMLSIVCCAITPLTDTELLDALAFEPGNPYKFDCTRKFDDTSALEEICSDFIEIDFLPDNGKRTVRIAHFSVQEYLESEKMLPHQDIAMFHVQKQDSHTNIATVCLTLLLTPMPDGVNVSYDRSQMYPLLDYAARFWPEHLAQCNSKLGVEDLALKLLRHPYYFYAWIAAWDFDNSLLGFLGNEIPTPLYYAALLGLNHAASELLNGHGPGTSLAEFETTRLRLRHQDRALNYEAVRLLLGKSAITNFRGGENRKALKAALAKGCRDIMNLLLEKSAETDTQGGTYGTALQAASEEGHRVTTNLLLEKGADADTQGGTYGTALQAASANGHKDIVKLLLEKGVDMEIRRGNYGTALRAASAKGYLEITKLLLQKGANANVQGREYGTALQAVAENGHTEIAKLLLENGADTNIHSRDYGTPLRIASNKGHIEVVRLLLEYDADTNIPNTEGKTALYTASEYGFIEIAKLLLDKGADTNIPDTTGTTILYVASFRRHKKIAKLLLENGAKTHIKGIEDGKSFYSALYKNDKDIVEILKDRR